MSEPIAVTLTQSQLDKLDRFKTARGLASRDDALALLLETAFDSVDQVDQAAPVDQARALADRLRAAGFTTEAERLHTATANHGLGHTLLETLREACQTILTTIEALDPKTQLLAEELRLEIDKRLLK